MKLQQRIQAKISKKNALQTLSGAFLIILTFVLNGFLSFVVVGFEWQRILTGEYWANFGLMTASELLVMYGMYLIQRNKDLEAEKITVLQKDLDRQREIVYTLDKVTEAEDWLREIYNYKQKLLIYEKKIKSMYDTLKIVKPEEGEKNYSRKSNKYNKQLAKKEFLKEQFEFIKIDKKRLKLIIENASEKEIDELEKKLDTDDYLFKTARIKYKDVYWGNLLSGAETQSQKDTTPFFNEKVEISKSATRTIGVGCIVSAFVSALTAVGITDMGWGFWMNMILNAVILIFFLVRGVILSKLIILGKYYKSLEKRKSIYVAMLKDLGISKVIIKGKEDEQESD